MRSQPQIDECSHVENQSRHQKIATADLQKITQSSFKHFNLKKNLIEFYNHPFKDLSPIC